MVYVGKDANGKRVYESITGATEAEVNMLAAQRRYEVEKGMKKAKIPSDMTVEEAIQKYIDDRDSILAPKTIRECKGYLRNHYDGIKNVRLSKLTEAMIQKEVNREARTLSPKSIRTIYGLFHSAVKTVMPDYNFTIIYPQKEKKEMKIPTKEELIMLLNEVEGKRLEIPVLLAATCGMRRGEIAALDLKKDVDYKKNKIKITKAISNNDKSEWVIKPPKTTDSRRTIDCPEWVMAKLAAARDDPNYKLMHPAHITSAFARVCEKLGVDIRFHDLRHYFASLMLSLGVPDKYAMARLGHSTPNMLKTVYQHLMDDKDAEVTAQINGYFEVMQHDLQHDLQHDMKLREEKEGKAEVSDRKDEK